LVTQASADWHVCIRSGKGNPYLYLNRKGTAQHSAVVKCKIRDGRTVNLGLGLVSGSTSATNNRLVIKSSVQVQIQVFDSKCKSHQSIMSMSQQQSLRSLLALQCQNEAWSLRQVTVKISNCTATCHSFEHGGASLC